MAEANASAEEKWATARMTVLSDLTDELASAAAMAELDSREWEEWLAGHGIEAALGTLQSGESRRSPTSACAK